MVLSNAFACYYNLVVIHAYNFLVSLRHFLNALSLLRVHTIPIYRVHRLYDTHPFSVPKSAGNMTVQDPNMGVSPSKSVNSPTGHHVYGKVLPST